MRGRHRHLLICLLLATAVSSCDSPRNAGPAPVYHFGGQAQSYAGAGDIVAQKGDTLWNVSQRYGVELRDIIDANNLAPPYRLSPGQRLRLPPPERHKVEEQDTLYQLSRMYGVPVSQLVRINRLRKPYLLKVGQVVRIPARDRRTQIGQQPRPARGMLQEPIVATRLAPPLPVAAPEPVRETVSRAASKPAFLSRMPIVGDEGPRQDFIWPVKGKLISSYGPKAGQLFNDGINIAAPRGTPVKSAAAGVVAYAGQDLASYGNLVLVRHSGGLVTAYAHLGNITVKKGDKVAQGQTLGTVGSTGTVANSQLHFEVRRGIKTYDPAEYL